jgi:endonuclease/exonuclease/phosphatase family metal-dependent hydrolase
MDWFIVVGVSERGPIHVREASKATMVALLAVYALHALVDGVGVINEKINSSGRQVYLGASAPSTEADDSAQAKTASTAWSSSVASDTLRLFTQNLHFEARHKVSALKDFAESNDVDVIHLQELSEDDARFLRRSMPQWNIFWALADPSVKIRAGGQGNALLSKRPLENRKTVSLKGGSWLSTLASYPVRFGQAVGSGDDIPPLAKERPEDRVILSAELNAQPSEPKTEYLTVHLGGDPYQREKELDKLGKRLEASRNRASFICGDFNDDPKVIRSFFLRHGFYAELTAATSVRSARTIDYCAFAINGLVRTVRTRVVKDVSTDHDGVLMEVELQDSPTERVLKKSKIIK